MDDIVSSKQRAGSDNEGSDKEAARRERIAEAASRARAEAESRRKKIDAVAKAMPREVDGRKGLEPVRFGDWEVDGKASDF